MNKKKEKKQKKLNGEPGNNDRVKCVCNVYDYLLYLYSPNMILGFTIIEQISYKQVEI